MKNKIKKLSVSTKGGADLPTDAELAAGVRQGDMQCFAEIITRCTPHLKPYLHFLMHNSTLEKDALQDTFISALQQFQNGKYHEEGKLLPWLKGIAFLMAHKVADPEKKFVHDEKALEKAEAEVTEAPVEKDTQRLAAIRIMLNRFSPRQQLVFILRMFRHLPYTVIGIKMNIDINTATTMFSKTKSKLEILLHKNYPLLF